MSLKAIKSIDYVVLACRDIARARDFYSRILGFDVTYERDDWVKFNAGPISLALRPETGPFDGRTVSGPALQLAFEVAYSDIDRCFEELKAHGVSIIERPTNQVWGHRTLFFLDSEGNVLEVYANTE